MDRLRAVLDVPRSRSRGAAGRRSSARRVSARPASPASSAPRPRPTTARSPFEIRCDRAGDATFAPIAQLIRDATDLGDDTDADVGARAARHAARRRRSRPRPPRRRPRRARRRGAVPFASRRRSGRSAGSSSATAADRPMVVVIDDIQWAEPLLLDLLEHLAEWVAGRPAAPARAWPGPSCARSGRRSPSANRRVEDVLALDGLDSAATEALAAGLLGTDRLPAGLVERLPDLHRRQPAVRARARPHARGRRGHPPRDGDEWELTIDAEAVEVPPTIQSLLAARVERLPGDERAVLELASVIGAGVQPRRAARARRCATRRSPRCWSRCGARSSSSRPAPTGATSPCTASTTCSSATPTYRRLLKTTRADLHEQVAVWTDARRGRTSSASTRPSIAFHYEQAYRYRSELGSVDDHVDRSRPTRRRAAVDRGRPRPRPATTSPPPARSPAARWRCCPTPTPRHGPSCSPTACECMLASGDVAGGPARRRAAARRGRRRPDARRVGVVLRGAARRPHRSRGSRRRRGHRDRRGRR